MSRPRPTATDYMVIALTPALIMTLVGSLVFFLLAVFYQGQFEARLHFIMAMFVMAAVLIGRISIEEGREYAMLFAVPLGIVTAIAANRFVEFRGPFASWSLAISLGLIALIWWCTDCLTWDCTVIDESQDASGEGLLQTVGLDRDNSQAAGGTATPDLEGTSARVQRPSPTLNVWQKFLQYRRRKHAPGVWVIYFSLAALPIFGLGQWSVDSSNLDARRHVFHLLVVYVASALGLLLTTSFLGLRRYLRQRRLEMPGDMAVVWLTTGGMLIGAILLACLILPRRNPEYSPTQLPIFASAPDNLSPSRWGFGNDGPTRDDADRPGGQQSSTSQQEQKDGGDGRSPSENSKQNKSRPSNQQPSNQQPSNQQPSNQQPSNQQPSNQQPSNQQPSNQQPSNQQPSNQQPSNQQPSNQQPSNQQPSNQQSPNQQSPNQQSPNQQSPNQQSPNQQSSKRTSDSDRETPQSERSESPESSRPSDPKQPSEQSQSQDQSGQNQQSEPASANPPNSTSLSPSRLFSQLGAAAGSLFRLFYWLAVIVLVAFLLWRYWPQVVAAIRNFVRSLQEFWNSLFGGRTVEPEAEEESHETVRLPSFADFRDPFLTGDAERWSAAELLRYSFLALEAWSRERGYPRSPEQTPSEFMQIVASRERRMSREVLQLGELYNVSAYGKAAKQLDVVSVRRLWAALRETQLA